MKRASPFALYRATVGRRRQYETESLAREYERGYNNYPQPPKNPKVSTAEQQGYLDAKAASTSRET